MHIYRLLASNDSIKEMEDNYRFGGYGYGHAKIALYELLLENFSEERRRFDTLMKNQNEIKDVLRLGASKARLVADETLRKVKNSLGYV